jgi:hypothetical protein
MYHRKIQERAMALGLLVGIVCIWTSFPFWLVVGIESAIAGIAWYLFNRKKCPNCGKVPYNPGLTRRFFNGKVCEHCGANVEHL